MSLTTRSVAIFSLLFIFACSQPYSIKPESLVDTGIQIDLNGDIIPPEELENNPDEDASDSSSSVAEEEEDSSSSVAEEEASSSSVAEEVGNSSSSNNPDEGNASSASNPSEGNICDQNDLDTLKVDVCHDGIDINISVNAWCNGHSKHEDDYLGKCLNSSASTPEAKTCNKGSKSSRSSSKVYTKKKRK